MRKREENKGSAVDAGCMGKTGKKEKDASPFCVLALPRL
jgi:hypothetical protein